MHALNLGLLQYFAGGCLELLMGIGSEINMIYLSPKPLNP